MTVLVRRRPSPKALHSMIKEMGAKLPNKRKYLSHEEFAATQGADPKDLEKVEEFANEHNLDIVEVNTAQRLVMLLGRAADISEAFGIYLARYEHPKGTYRGRTGPIQLPEDIAPIIEILVPKV